MTASTRKRLLIILGLAAAMIVTLANVHFIYAAIASQPDCVPHLKMPDGAVGTYRAAKSAC